MNLEIVDDDAKMIRNEIIGTFFESDNCSISMEILSTWPKIWINEIRFSKNIINSEQIVKNLIYLTRQLHIKPLEDFANDESVRSSLDIVEAIGETYAKLRGTFALLYETSMLKMFAAVILSLGDTLTDDLIRSILKILMRMKEDGNFDRSEETKMMAKQVYELILNEKSNDLDLIDKMKSDIRMESARLKRDVQSREAVQAITDPRAFSKRRLEHEARKRKEHKRAFRGAKRS
jgi:hypothetical protein